MNEIRLSLHEVPDGGARIVVADDKVKIAVFRVGTRVAAIQNRCPHAGASLGDGFFDGTTVKCPLHGFRVDVWKGIGNAGRPVQTFPVVVEQNEIRIAYPIIRST